jgi:RNA polymerase sigma factor
MENNSESLNERVQNLKNSEELDRLINEYKPFIASVTQSATGKFVHYGEDDELSIALIAFEEAIKAYDSSKGNFLSFAKNVIKRRLIDYFRKENRFKNVLSLDQKINAEDDDEDYDVSSEISIKQFSESELAEARRNEITELKNELSEWGITFFDVAKSSPKHEKTRKICMQIVSEFLEHIDMVS